jgi:colicin import membrane protein
MTDDTPYTVPQEPGRWRAIILAAVVHIALLAFLWIGVHWQNNEPATVEAEVWSPQAREAAPVPPPVSEPEPQPVVKTPPPPPPVEKPVEQPKIKQPDIALEQEKKRKEEERKKQEAEEQHQAKLKEQKDREQREQKLAEQKKIEQEKLDKQKTEKAAQDKKLAEEKKRKQEEADKQLLARLHEEDMRRITGVAGTGGAGDAPKSQGSRDASYAQRVGAKIKSNINFTAPDDLAGNPAVEFEVNLLPDGSVAGIRKRKSSGVPGFDEAVARAIEKSQPYPKDKNGSVPSSFIGVHKPKDQ